MIINQNMKISAIKSLVFILIAGVLLISCGGNTTQEAIVETVIRDDETIMIPTITPTPTPQSFSGPKTFGPNSSDFPLDYNPLNAQQMEDPSTLRTPALLVSISHFPPAARPQAGLSFAPWVFEFYITEGATRFLSVFYGDYPRAEIPTTGDCEVRKNYFTQTANILGNRVWLDENENGRQEDYEPGVGGICVNLYSESGELIDQTTTDSNGYYGFNVEDGAYIVEFTLPDWLEFTENNVGDENADSDADTVTGRAEPVISSSALYWDAGVIPSEKFSSPIGPAAKTPETEVGPIRSGRLFYDDIHTQFRSSCLIYAFASPEVLKEIPQCVFVPHDEASGGAMMSLERMMTIAEDNKRTTPNNFDYSGTLFTEEVPEGGVPATVLHERIALLNQSKWIYDPLSGSYLRFVDDAKTETVGQLHPEIDRLTGRQLQFDNVVIIELPHDTISPTNIDIQMELGQGGYAYLFRDGQKFDALWSLKAREYEKTTGRSRPFHLTDRDGNQLPLKPGNTWIFVATPYSYLSEVDGVPGYWLVRYVPPIGAK